MTKAIKIQNRLMDFDTAKVMGIINITPDSFYPGSRTQDAEAIYDRVALMLDEGVDILDLGGYSTRPGAPDVSADEELYRLQTALEVIRTGWPEIPISIDTFRSRVARECITQWHADIINDISGGTADAGMFDTVAETGAAYVLMHTRGTPQTMQSLTDYADVTADVISNLAHKLAKLRGLGVADVIIDPGFGFAKTVEQNYEMLSRLQEFKILGCPVLAGISRKSMITRVLGNTSAEALNGTTVLNTIALLNGADILRVHDVLQAREAVKLCEMLKQGN